jgi:hypothetical protein
MTTQILNVIIKEIKSAKYFSIVIDPTSDISHSDQLTYVIRYVRDDGFPIERFMCFYQMLAISPKHLKRP